MLHLDELLAVIVLVWGVMTTVAQHSHKGPLSLNLGLVVVVAGALVVRRRLPLTFTAVTLGCALIGALWLDDLVKATWSTYMLVLPAYTVAAFLELPQALLGLALAVGGTAAVDAFQRHTFIEVLFTTIFAVAAWTTGHAMRHRRALARELRHRAAWLEAEREDRARLAVADERSRIARELHAVVANSVSAMVVQAEAAQCLLDEDLASAEEAMEEIESTGREALAEMRRILGVLRRGDEGPELAPQPGVGQLHTLVERGRGGGRRVGLSVEGEPRPLPVSVDLAVYRIVEEALQDSIGPADIALRFDDEEVELELTCAGAGGHGWPTVAMYERVALCEGSVVLDEGRGTGERLLVRLPPSFVEAFA